MSAASVRARLLNRARETQQDFNLVLTRYAIERLPTKSALILSPSIPFKRFLPID